MGVLAELTSTEKSILNLLDSDSRLSFSQIGKKIKKSQQLVSSTVKSLTDRKIIKGYYTQIDYSKLGVLNFRVYFKVSYLDQNKFEKFVTYLANYSQSSWLMSCGGNFDIICTFYALNPSQFNKNLKNIIVKFPRLIRGYTLLTTIVMQSFKMKRFFNIIPSSEVTFIGGDREKEIINDVDLCILDLLAERARISSVEIGNKLCLTPKTVIDHIRRLEKKKIICGFRTLLNLKGVECISMLLFVKYHNRFVRLEERFIDYLKTHPNIISIIKTLGEWDLEIEVEVKTKEEFREIEIKIKQEFASLIQDIQSISLYEVYKRNFFPKILLKKYKKKIIH